MPQLLDFQQVRAKKDPAPNWRWIVQMPTLTSSISIANFPAPYTGLNRVSSAPNGMVERISFSNKQIDSDQRFGAGARLNYPRFQSTTNASITMYEDVEYNSLKFIHSWMNLVVDENHNYGVPAIYKHPIMLYAFDYTSNTSPILVGSLIDCWPTGFSGLEYAYDSSGPITITVDFAVDDIQLAPGAGASLSASASIARESGIGGLRGFLNGALGGIRDAVGAIRGVAGEITNTVNQVMEPVRDITQFARDATSAVREGFDAVRQVQDAVMSPIREVRSTVDMVTGTVREGQAMARTIMDMPRNLSTEITGTFRGIGSGFGR